MQRYKIINKRAGENQDQEETICYFSSLIEAMRIADRMNADLGWGFCFVIVDVEEESCLQS